MSMISSEAGMALVQAVLDTVLAMQRCQHMVASPLSIVAPVVGVSVQDLTAGHGEVGSG